MGTLGTAGPRLPASTPRPLRLTVTERAQIGPHLVRVSLGGPDVQLFHALGHDQWFRLFLPAPDGTLDAVPDAASTREQYARFMAVPDEHRPVLRNYTVRQVRGEGATRVIDVDFVLHGHGGTGAGVASEWARTCALGSQVALLDEGVMFNRLCPDAAVHLIADEAGLAGAAGILRDLPADTRGWAVLEVPSAADMQVLPRPSGMRVVWVPRDAAPMGQHRAVEVAARLPLASGPVYCWAAGESGLATDARRHWVARGVPKSDITFCGYWRCADHLTNAA